MAAKDTLENLIEIEGGIVDLQQGNEVACQDALQKYLDAREPLCKRRFELVSGKYPPTSEELEGYTGPANKSGQNRGIPYFWLNVLCNEDTISEHITARDKLALEYCEDIRFNRGPKGMLVEFLFRSNPYFANKSLRRGLFVEEDEEGGVVRMNEEATDIDWKDGKSLLVKGTVKKSGKKGGKGAKKDESELVRHKSCASFFRFFLPLARPVDPTLDPTAEAEEPEDVDTELDGRQTAKRSHDTEILKALIKRVVPKAVELYLSGPLQAGSQVGSGDEEEDYELVTGANHSEDSMPTESRSVVYALKKLQEQFDALAKAYKQTEWEMAKELYEGYTRITDKRRKVLVQDGSLAISGFWLKVLKSADLCLQTITRADEKLLQYISDIRWQWDWSHLPSADEGRAGTLEIEFFPNEFLKTTVLRKKYEFTCRGSSITDLAFGSCEPEPVEWKDDSTDLTLKVSGGKTKNVPSFFNYFKKGGSKYMFQIVGNDKAAIAEAIECEVELIQELQNIVLHAAVLYKKRLEAGEDDDDVEEEEEEEDDDEDGVNELEGTEDAQERQARKAARKARSKGFKLTKAHVFFAFILIMLLANVFVFFEMASVWRQVL